MNLPVITSRDNAYVRDLATLVTSSRERKKTGRSVLDGVHLVEAFLQSGRVLESVAVRESAADTPATRQLLSMVPSTAVRVLADKLIDGLSQLESAADVLAVVVTPEGQPVPPGAPAVLLLDNLQDPGNVGTLLRTAAALGVQHAVLGEGTAFAWSPKVLRAGQGAHFSINIVEGVALATFLEGYHGNTLALVAAGEGAVPLAHAPFSEPFALMVGNEGQGLQPGLLARASHRVHIPMAGKVESLNAAAAGAIALYEWSRRCA